MRQSLRTFSYRAFVFFTFYAGCLLAAGVWADQNKPASNSTPTVSKQAVQDVWIDTRLETAYLFNRHLNNFSIQTDVNSGHVLLTGTVESDIDKDLAGEIAQSVPGVQSVKNHLILKSEVNSAEQPINADEQQEGRKFVELVDDATTTARVKTKLVRNENIRGMAIDVDTQDAVVTLSGEVKSREQKQLAELLARNVTDVKSVNNKLVVKAS